ncbi:MAG: glycosyl hydrolase family 18 protein [Acidimicrobiales bacterium]
MRSLLRPPHHAVGQPALTGVPALPVDPGPPEDGVAEALEGTPDQYTRYDLRVTALGLIVGPSDSSEHEVPSLVPWSAIDAVSAEVPVVVPGGPTGQLLELSVVDPCWLGGDATKTFVVPATEVGPFLRATSAGGKARGGLIGGTLAAATALRSRAANLLSIRSPDGHDPRHGTVRRRLGPVAVALLALLLLAGSASTSFGSAGNAAPTGRGPGDQGNRVQASKEHLSADLPAATAAPLPAPPSLASSPPLQSHEVFGYAPYWTLPQSSGFDVQDLTTLAYFSVDANGNGTLDESGAGWNGYESQDLANLVTRSHAAGDRVVLTVTCFSQSSLDQITSDPNAASRLSSALITAVAAKNLDGVNFDFEGEGSADRNGLTALITQVSAALHAANPHWQVTMAAYASAAGDPSGFYDVAALAPALDGFFVMAYDMNDRTSPSATAPLVGGGFDDTEALQQFTAVVPPSKVILGVPYYGYDWPTTDGTIAAQATGPESPLTDAVIDASGHPTYWDPTTQTVWTSYQVGSQWHETYFDDPTSLALKAQLANSFHIAGVGIWALGMDGNDPAMLAALLGNAPAAKDLQTGPTTTTPTSSTSLPGAGSVTTGVFDNATVPLAPVAPPANYGTVQYLGTLTGLQTNAPSLTCLEGGAPISVWTFSALPGVDVAVSATPQNCIGAMFTFPPPATSPSASTTTTTTSPPTSTTAPATSTTVPRSTTTTTSPSTTTTTSTVPPSTTTTSP